jgi:hypothetical protein
MNFYDQKLRNITLRQCFWVAIEDGTNIVFMALGCELTITRVMAVSVSESLGMDTRPENN